MDYVAACEANTLIKQDLQTIINGNLYKNALLALKNNIKCVIEYGIDRQVENLIKLIIDATLIVSAPVIRQALQKIQIYALQMCRENNRHISNDLIFSIDSSYFAAADNTAAPAA